MCVGGVRGGGGGGLPLMLETGGSGNCLFFPDQLCSPWDATWHKESDIPGRQGDKGGGGGGGGGV